MQIVGIIRTSQVIDFEETKQLEFSIVAYDTGIPQLSSTALVTLTVLNINDEDPKFEKDLYNVTVEENSPPGTRITVVKAYDADEGLFGEVNYSLMGDHASDFNIGKNMHILLLFIMYYDINGRYFQIKNHIGICFST